MYKLVFSIGNSWMKDNDSSQGVCCPVEQEINNQKVTKHSNNYYSRGAHRVKESRSPLDVVSIIRVHIADGASARIQTLPLFPWLLPVTRKRWLGIILGGWLGNHTGLFESCEGKCRRLPEVGFLLVKLVLRGISTQHRKTYPNTCPSQVILVRVAT